jgi:hypothetical protein
VFSVSSIVDATSSAGVQIPGYDDASGPDTSSRDNCSFVNSDNVEPVFIERTPECKSCVHPYIISILNASVAVASFVYIYLNQGKQTKILASLVTMQTTQLQVGNELADKLTKAQKTTEQISSELSRNTSAVGKVLNETERALQPLGSLSLLCELQLPKDHPEVSAALSRFEAATAGQKRDVSLERPDPRVYLLRPAPKGLGFAFLPDSPLYPKPDTALSLIVRSISVELQFHQRHFRPAQYAIASRPSPDLRVEFRDQSGSKWIHIQEGNVYFGLRSGVPKMSGAVQVAYSAWRI